MDECALDLTSALMLVYRKAPVVVCDSVGKLGFGIRKDGGKISRQLVLGTRLEGIQGNRQAAF